MGGRGGREGEDVREEVGRMRQGGEDSRGNEIGGRG